MEPRDRALWQTSLEETAAAGTTPAVFRALQDRVKVLSALHAALQIVQDAALTESQALAGVAALIPQAFNHPNDAGARITRGSESYESPGFCDSRFKLRAPFHTRDGREGAILVTYQRDHVTPTGGPFHSDERRFLETLAGTLAGALDRRTGLERLTLALSTGVRIWEWDIPADRLTWPDIEVGDPPGPLTAMFEEVLLHLHPDDRAPVRRAVEETLHDPSRHDELILQCRVAYPGPVYRWRHVTGRLVRDPKGRPLRMIGLSTDIAEQQDLQDRLRQAEKMEALGRLAGGISHDFNNVLFAILGFAEIAQSRLPPGHPAHGPVSEIMKAGQTARKVVQQIVAFSRRQDLKPARIDLAAALRDWEGMIRPLIGSHYSFEIRVDPATPAVLADSGQLFQVLLNLSINARDAMPKGGAITVRTGARRRDQRDWAVIEFQDSGDGVPRDVLPHIFEPFFTTKSAGKGTGMGLATVHGIVTQSGGILEVESEPGRGALFRIYLPVTT